MTKTVNPAVIRLSTTKTWPNLWHSEYNYSELLNQDFLIKNYIRTQLKQYGIGLIGFNIKRSLTSIYIILSVFNYNSLNSLQFTRKYHMSSYFFIRSIFDYETSRFVFAIYRLTGQINVRFFVKKIYKQRFNLKTIMALSSPLLLSIYFFRRYFKMGGYKSPLKTFKKVFNKPYVLGAKNNTNSIKLVISGPLKAPRNRRSLSIKHIFFGSTPFQTFNNYVEYSLKSKVLSEGVVTARFYFFKKFRSLFLNRKSVRLMFEFILFKHGVIYFEFYPKFRNKRKPYHIIKRFRFLNRFVFNQKRPKLKRYTLRRSKNSLQNLDLKKVVF